MLNLTEFIVPHKVRSDCDQAKLVADATRLAIVRNLIERIEAAGPLLVDEAMGRVHDRLRKEGPSLEQAQSFASRKLPRAIAALAAIDADLAEHVFRPSRADLIVDELRRFVLEHKIGAANAGRARR